MNPMWRGTPEWDTWDRDFMFPTIPGMPQFPTHSWANLSCNRDGALVEPYEPSVLGPRLDRVIAGLKPSGYEFYPTMYGDAPSLSIREVEEVLAGLNPDRFITRIVREGGRFEVGVAHRDVNVLVDADVFMDAWMYANTYLNESPVTKKDVQVGVVGAFNADPVKVFVDGEFPDIEKGSVSWWVAFGALHGYPIQSTISALT